MGNVVITVEGFSIRVSSPVNLANHSLTLSCTQAAGNYYNTVIMIISSVIMRRPMTHRVMAALWIQFTFVL